MTTAMHKTWCLITGLVFMSALLAVAFGEGECSKDNPCKGGECCSKFGFCGCTDEYCGNGCVDNCRPNCEGRVKAGECSKDNPCKGGECCSKFGFCGCTDEYCGNGCVDNCRPNCEGRVKAGECSKDNPCKGGECCSKFGFCGCTEAYCGNGCVDSCRPNCDRGVSADNGEATYYTTYVPSSCYGFDTSNFPKGNMIAAASTDVFGNKAACGTYYEITCKGAASGGGNPCSRNPTVKVMVVDLCPGCNRNSFDLSREAFSKIANLDAGRIKISAKRVSKNHKTNEEVITEVV